MGLRERVAEVERVFAFSKAPCSPVVACRVIGIYLHRTGLDPAGFPRGDFAFMFDVDPNGRERQYDPYRNDEERQFYEANVQKAIEYHKGRIRGDWG